MSFSCSESDYIALSEAVKEVKFVFQFLRSMKISIKLPVMVRVDDVGTIVMASNITTMLCTKHMDKYGNKYVEDRVITIAFVKSVDNNNHVLTKNLSANQCAKHSKKMVGEKL